MKNVEKTKKRSIREYHKAMDKLLAKEYRPLSSWNYFGRSILYSIPLIGWIFLLAHAIKGKNRHGKSFARSYFCALLILAIAGAIAFALFQMGLFPQTPNQTTSDPTKSCAHETTEWIVDKNATCSTEGSKHKECVSCKENLETAVIATTAHTEEVVAGKAASCTEDGLTAGKKCSVCQAVILEQQKIDALNHSESDWIVDKIAEVGVAGSKHKECTRCSTLLQTESIPALEEECTHEQTEWITVTHPSCMQTGERKEICRSCGTPINTIKLGMVGHIEKIVLGTAATCTESGRTDGQQCAVCGTSIVSQIILPPLGHSFSDETCTICGISEPYGIWITDGLGNPMNDIFIKVMQNGEQIKMFPYNGTFLNLGLEDGTYQLVLDLSQLSKTYTYDASLCTLTPEKPSASIRLFQTPIEETSVYVGYPLDADYTAYVVGEGATQITLPANKYTFFIFAPQNAGIYAVTHNSGSKLKLSYHGSTFYVQGHDLSADSTEVSAYENGLAVNVYASNLGGDYVFAVKAKSKTTFVLNIQNIGDPGNRVEDEPWTPYLEDAEMVDKQLNTPTEGTYTTIDLTDLSVKAVYNEADGFYHLGTADGPIIFIDLTSDSKYVASIQTICALQRMGTYIYDIDGNLVEKRSYNELFRQYGLFTETEDGETPVSGPIRVPLTQKLVEAIQCFGDKNGWWDPTLDSNIFQIVLLGAPYNQEYAWLLYCGYYA